MKRLFLIFGIIFFIIPTNVSGQSDYKWKIWGTFLDDVKIKYAYMVEYDIYLPKPKFGSELKKLDGKEITINGFFLPVDVTGDVFVLSYNPMNMCFFCTGTGIETIIEINAADDQIDKFKRLKTDNYISVRGILKLNSYDYEHLIYILNDVELLEIIR